MIPERRKRSGHDRLASEAVRTYRTYGAFQDVVRTEQDVERIFWTGCRIDVAYRMGVYVLCVLWVLCLLGV